MHVIQISNEETNPQDVLIHMIKFDSVDRNAN